jgi:hypothetical protein
LSRRVGDVDTVTAAVQDAEGDAATGAAVE